MEPVNPYSFKLFYAGDPETKKKKKTRIPNLVLNAFLYIIIDILIYSVFYIPLRKICLPTDHLRHFNVIIIISFPFLSSPSSKTIRKTNLRLDSTTTFISFFSLFPVDHFFYCCSKESVSSFRNSCRGVSY